MSILVDAGRVSIAESIALRPIHLAWGSGDGVWVTPPAESLAATALQTEIGRRVATEVAFVTPDAGGNIVLPNDAVFNRSVTPTNHIYIRTAFDFEDGLSEVIREIAVFVGTTTSGALPPGQEYFTPAQVTSPGRMLSLENIGPIYRSPAIRESFEVVITF
jgi:hypothetical protein